MVIYYCIELSQSYSITQLTQTPDNSTQITIPFGTYLHVDWPTLLKTLLTWT